MKLLSETGVSFARIIPDLEEAPFEGEHPYNFAERLARDKALQVARRSEAGDAVIGCDTVVVLEGEVLGKPANESDAYEILSRLSGKRHVVCTALAIAEHSGILASGYELTEVRFNKVTAEQIREYIATGEPMDKAGAYGIQGMGAFLVDSIKGELDTVIGFPRTLLERLAKQVIEE
ncbi:MAG: septum formation protein Maf [Candidatus Zixiibacteriota bacterium]|nr:MAG: septum formation protein Maf [candidate division Zixibacteria bacterium]